MIAKLTKRDDTGRVSYMELIEKLGVDTRPVDTSGVSTKIIEGSIAAEEKRLADQDERRASSLVLLFIDIGANIKC